MKRILAALALIVGLGVTLTACAPTAEAIEVEPTTVIIDVRTPEEFASGHLEDAVNIDVQSGDFAARISELDPEASYIVYCRSGARAGNAVAQMAELGITDAVNAGGVDAASLATGIPIVTG